jgi:hypothetical protein
VDVLAEDVGALLGHLPATPAPVPHRPDHPLTAEDAHASILRVARETHADVVVLTTPFLADYADLGHDSLGATVDVLAERMHLPMLCARDPARGDVPAQVVLFVEDADERALRAAGWALRLGRDDLRVVVAASAAEREGWQHLAGQRFALDDEAVREALALGTAPLVGAVNREAQALGLEPRVRVAVEPLVDVVHDKNERPAIFVVPYGPLWREVLLHARNPVLVVP